MVRQVESEKWCDATDWLGDRFLDLRTLVGELSIDRYLDRMGEYHKLVIDKNNASEAEIDAIFNRVYQVDGAYVARFAACQTRIERYCLLLDQVAETVNPSKGLGSFDPDSLKTAFEQFDEREKVLAKISTSDDGVSHEDLDAMSAEARQMLLQHLVRGTIDYMPALNVGEEFELPIGRNISVYYSVKGSAGDSSLAELNAAIENGRAELKKFDIKGSTGEGAVKLDTELSSDGTAAVSVSGGRASLDFDFEGVKYSTSWKYGDNTYTYADGFEFASAKFYTEESVKTEIEGGSVTSIFGLKSSQDNGWEPVYVPVPVPAYDPVTLPQWEAPDVDWHAVGVGVAVGVVVIAGVALTVFTFGGSDAAAGAAAAALVVAL